MKRFVMWRPAAFACMLGLLIASRGVAGDTRFTVISNTAFACDMYATLKPETGNFLFSPYSISTAFAIAYSGARGNTAKQISKVFHFDSPAALNVGLGDLQLQFQNANRQGLELSIANAFWIQRGEPFMPAFLSIATSFYGANVNQADFQNENVAESARAAINTWVGKKTRDRMPEVLSQGSIIPGTAAVLVNAIYFKGTWVNQFDKSVSMPQPFYISASKKVNTPLMQHFDSVKYVQAQDLQAVELPYKGNQISIVILLPSKVDGYGSIESRLSPTFLWRVISLLKEEEVEILLPRFKFESTFDLHMSLAKQMPDVFSSKAADFSGINGKRDLFIDAAIHQAWIEVNEEGTEAAAVTGIGITAGLAPPPPPVFRADHPFIFFIRDTRSGSILFLGRFAEPEG